MATYDLNDKDWQKLIRNVECGTCILMLGSDIPLVTGKPDEPSFFGGDSDKKLAVLSQLNYFVLRNDKGLERLVNDIQDDQQKRRTRKEQAGAS